MKFILFLCISLLTALSHAQTAKEIVDTYIEKSGGFKAWDSITGTKIDATLEKDGVNIPMTIYHQADGKQAIEITLEEQQITQLAFNGSVYWTTDMATMQPVIANQETIDNVKLSKNDFPSPLIHYMENEYKIAYLGEKKLDSITTFKVILTKEPLRIKGEKLTDNSFYYFDTETYLPLKIESLKPNGKKATFYLGDYQEVQGISFPFTIKQDSTTVSIKNITLNPEVDPKIFEFPTKS